MIVPGRTAYLTIRAVNRQYRFAPSPEVVQSIEFIFWHCVDLYKMSVHDALWMSNHAHICITDELGVLPKFVCQMNSMLSRQLNALRKQKGTNFERAYSDIQILDDQSVSRLCAYTLANPCAANLVSSAERWKGMSTYKLEYNRPFVVKRPNCGIWKDKDIVEFRRPKSFRPKPRKTLPDEPSPSAQERTAPKKKSTLPTEVTARLVRPKIYLELSDEQLRAKIREETKIREQIAAEKRKRAGKSVLGWKNVRNTKWFDFPRAVERLFREIPLLASSCPARTAKHRELIAAFRQAYKEARDLFILQGKDKAEFPWGTWKMRVELRVTCATSPPETSIPAS